MARVGHVTSFADLPDLAAELLVDILSQQGSIQVSRLACRALLRLVDEHVAAVRLLMRPTFHQRLSEGGTPYLERWCGCTSVTLMLCPLDGEEESPIDVSTLVTNPFIRLSAQRNGRITQLDIRQAPSLFAFPRADVAMGFPTLPCYLPNLRELSLAGIWCMTYEMYEQQLLHLSLKALRHLRSLALPSCRAVDYVGLLAELPLQRLHIHAGGRAQDGVLSQQAADGISQLSHLEELVFTGCAFPYDPAELEPPNGGGLPLLLDRLPPSLRRLRCSRAAEPLPGAAPRPPYLTRPPVAAQRYNLQLQLHESRATEVRIWRGGSPGELGEAPFQYAACCTPEDCAHHARLLLASGAASPGLGQSPALVIPEGLRLSEREDTLARPEVAPFWELVRGSPWVEVGTLAAICPITAHSVLGCVHRIHQLRLCRKTNSSRGSVTLHLQVCAPSPGPISPTANGGGDPDWADGAGTSGVQSRAGGGSASVPPAAPDLAAPALAAAALRRMLPPEAVDTAAAPASNGGSGGGNGVGSPSNSGGSGVGDGRASFTSSGARLAAGALRHNGSAGCRHLVIRGPRLASLLVDPKGLDARMRNLERKSVAAAAAAAAAVVGAVAGDEANSGEATCVIQAYQPLPHASAIMVVVTCDAAAQAALATAVSAEAAKGRRRAAFAEVLQLSDEAEGWARGTGMSICAYYRALELELQEVWDGLRGALDGHRGELALLLQPLLAAWTVALVAPLRVRLQGQAAAQV